jgi:disulfide bond formation protein DsbB
MGRLRLFVILLVIALAAAACGGSDDGDSGDGGDTAAAAETTAASGDGGGDAAAGEAGYQSTCAACHGADAEGIEGLGKDLHANAFVAENSDGEMVAFLKVGRPASDPANTTGVDMPPKGGNPSLSDEDLQNIVAYLRTLQ